MFSTTGIRINSGKTKIWNAPSGCGVLQRIAETHDPKAVVWRGSDLPMHRQGLKGLGTPLGHPDFARTSLEIKNIGHQCFLDRFPILEDGQSSWLLLARTNHMTRVVEPGATRISVRGTMKRCGSVCARSCGSHQPRPKTSDSQPVCRWYSEGRLCGAQHEFNKLRIGPVGLIVNPWCIRSEAPSGQQHGNPETRCSSAVREAKHELAVASLNHKPLHVEPAPPSENQKTMSQGLATRGRFSGRTGPEKPCSPEYQTR